MLKGLKGLFASKKGTLCLMILACSTIALFYGKLEGVSYAAIVGTIGTIYCWVTHVLDQTSMQIQPGMQIPPPAPMGFRGDVA